MPGAVACSVAEANHWSQTVRAEWPDVVAADWCGLAFLPLLLLMLVLLLLLLVVLLPVGSGCCWLQLHYRYSTLAIPHRY